MGEERYDEWEKVSVEELRAYFGLRISMGIVKLPRCTGVRIQLSTSLKSPLESLEIDSMTSPDIFILPTTLLSPREVNLVMIGLERCGQ